MKYYVVTDPESHSVYGYTNSKQIIEKFYMQRDMKRYEVYKLKEHELELLGIDDIEKEDELVLIGNCAMFLGEEQLFFDSLAQYQIDLRIYLERLFLNIHALKLSDYERHTVIKAFKILVSMLDKLELADDGDVKLNEIFNIDKMLQHIME